MGSSSKQYLVATNISQVLRQPPLLQIPNQALTPILTLTLDHLLDQALQNRIVVPNQAGPGRGRALVASANEDILHCQRKIVRGGNLGREMSGVDVDVFNLNPVFAGRFFYPFLVLYNLPLVMYSNRPMRKFSSCIRSGS